MSSEKDLVTWNKSISGYHTYRPRIAHPKHVTLTQLHTQVAKRYNKAQNRKTTVFTQMKQESCGVQRDLTSFNCEKRTYMDTPHTLGSVSASH